MEIILKNPIMLVLFLFLPVLIVLHYYFFEHNKKRAMRFANFSAMKRVTGTHLITKNTNQLILRIVIFSILILSAAHPIIWYEGKSNTFDYVIAIDSSASMVAEDVLPDRLTVAKQAAISFVDSLDSQTQIGLVAFSGVSTIKSPLTTDMTTLKQQLTNINIELSGGTDIGGALITSTNLLMPSEKTKTIILITDGSDTSGVFIDESVDTSLDYITKNHVIVNTIGIGTGLTKAGYLENSDLKAVYDKDTLSKIAEVTGGKFYEVKNTADMATAFKDIKSNPEKTKISYDAAGILMAFTLILLFFEWALLNTKFRALP
jgi:Ca-activated chloride channel homolog